VREVIVMVMVGVQAGVMVMMRIMAMVDVTAIRMT
jgi:hypothetical protein